MSSTRTFLLLVVCCLVVIVCACVRFMWIDAGTNHDTAEFFMELIQTAKSNVNCGTGSVKMLSAWSDIVNRLMMCTFRPEVCSERKPGDVFTDSEMMDLVSILDIDEMSCANESCHQQTATRVKTSMAACQFVLNNTMVRLSKQCNNFAVANVSPGKDLGDYEVSFLHTIELVKNVLANRAFAMKTSSALYKIDLPYVPYDNNSRVFVCISKSLSESGGVFVKNAAPQVLTPFFSDSRAGIVRLKLEQDNKDDLIETDPSIMQEFEENTMNQLMDVIQIRATTYYITQMVAAKIPVEIGTWNTVKQHDLELPSDPFAVTISFRIRLTRTSDVSQVMNSTKLFDVAYGSKATPLLSGSFSPNSENAKKYGTSQDYSVLVLTFDESNVSLPVYLAYGPWNTVNIVQSNTFLRVYVFNEELVYDNACVYVVSGCDKNYLKKGPDDGELLQITRSVDASFFKTDAFTACYGLCEH